MANSPQLPADPQRPPQPTPGAGSTVDASIVAFAAASVPLALIGNFSLGMPGALLGLLAAAALALGVMVWRLAHSLRDPLERSAPPPTYVKDRDAALRYAEMVLSTVARSSSIVPSTRAAGEAGVARDGQRAAPVSEAMEPAERALGDDDNVALRKAKLARLRQPFSLRAALEHLELQTKIHGELSARDDALAAIGLAIHTGQLKCAVDLWLHWSHHLNLEGLSAEHRGRLELALAHHASSSPNLIAVTESAPDSSPSTTNKSP